MDAEVAKQLEERRVELVKIITAFEALEKSEEWATLKELIFDKTVSSLERQLLSESLNKEIDLNNLYKLQGQWTFAKQYSEIDRYIESIKSQLENINNKIK